MADVLIVRHRRAERATLNPMTQAAKVWVKRNMTVDPPVNIAEDAIRELERDLGAAGLSVEVA